MSLAVKTLPDFFLPSRDKWGVITCVVPVLSVLGSVK